MMNRRNFVKTGAISVGAFGLLGTHAYAFKPLGKFISHRPNPGSRNFSSQVIEDKIAEMKAFLPNKELAWMFENCFPNTLDTTVQFQELDGKPDTFVITGDIEAMWLRDSTAQLWPYLPFCNEDPKLHQLIAGVIHRQTQCILIDPYANAFNKGKEGSPWESDITDMKPELHERKWEIDSLCYPIRLANGFYQATGDISVFDQKWKQAMKLIVATFKAEQRKDGKSPYSFMRKTNKQEDTVPIWGAGNPTRPIGLICSIFRPSDDATIFPFLIPSNLFAVKSLRQLAGLNTLLFDDKEFAQECLQLADEVESAIFKYAVHDHPEFGEVFAYEVDGFGNRLFIDDANIPGILSLPYLGCCELNDPVYKNSRRMVLSNSNPFFFKGSAGEGIGGPHVGMDMVWPMSIITRAMTSTDEKEIVSCLKMLMKTHADTGFMHESFHQDKPEQFTRSWFAWANTLFGELILKLHHEKPGLLKEV